MSALVTDTFTDTDSTAVASHAPDTNIPGNPWNAQGGDWYISSNRLFRNSGSNYATLDHEVADVDASVTIYNDGGTVAGLVLRYVDADNLIRAVIFQSGAMSLIKRVATAETTVGTYAAGATGVFPTGYGIRAVANGTNIKVYFDGSGTAEIDETVTDFSSSTLHGLYGGGGIRFDDFSSETVAAAGPALAGGACGITFVHRFRR
jgi:hypothetical protein